MKTTILVLLLVVLSLNNFAQTKMMTKAGKITFEASVPAFEEVKAKNEAVTFVLNPISGEIASLALIKGFRFKIALMEEHFNESYLESDKYPKAVFRGKIENFDIDKISSATKDYTIKGALEMHGKSKEITIKATLKKVGDGIEIISNFAVNSDDFAIDIPGAVSKKVSKKITVKLEATVK